MFVASPLGPRRAHVLLPRLVRSYAAASKAPTPADSAAATKARQQLQIRMTDKAARMKQNIGVTGNIPAFANYIRPAAFSKRVPVGTPWRVWLRYHLADSKSSLYDLWLRYQLRNMLGKTWHSHFMERAATAYTETNKSLASGNFETLAPLATHALVDSIKSQRLKNFQDLNLSWKLHKIVRQDIVCVRQQELQKKGEFVSQIAVRFVTDQSLEIRDARGELVGAGRHDAPTRVTEYYVFQREVWKRREDWKIMKKMNEVDPFNPGTEEVQLV